MPNFAADKLAAAEWARELLGDGTAVILDSETTGLGSNARICQLAIIDLQGNVLLDTLVNPQCTIPTEAIAIHGITDDMVKDAPELVDEIFNVSKAHNLKSRRFVVYNKDYDFRVIRQHLKETAGDYGFVPLEEECAMQQYAKFVGDWNDYHRSYKWQKLPAVKGYQAHSALGDCFATLALIKQMAAFAEYQKLDDIPF